MTLLTSVLIVCLFVFFYRALVIAAIVSTVQLASLDSQTNDIAVCALRDGQASIANKVKNDDSLSFYTVLFAVSQHEFSTTFLLYNQSTIKDIPMLRFSAGNPKLIQMNEYIRYKISDELTFSNISDGKAVL